MDAGDHWAVFEDCHHPSDRFRGRSGTKKKAAVSIDEENRGHAKQHPDADGAGTVPGCISGQPSQPESGQGNQHAEHSRRIFEHDGNAHRIGAASQILPHGLVGAPGRAPHGRQSEGKRHAFGQQRHEQYDESPSQVIERFGHPELLGPTNDRHAAADEQDAGR